MGSGKRVRRKRSGQSRPDPVADIVADPNQPWWFRRIVGPALRDFNNALPPGYRVEDIERVPGPNWCRFRRERHCWLPLDRDDEATAMAGYDVWIPVDRGLCVRETYEAQANCPVGEPGPDSGEKVFYPEATRSWAEGGQRRVVD